MEIKYWINIQHNNKDIDTLPFQESGHTMGAECNCNPRVDVVGANLNVVHNSYDNRELFEEVIQFLKDNKNDRR